MYSVTVSPKNKIAAECLKRNFKTLDDKFKEIHNKNLEAHGEVFTHGLRLFENGDFAYAYVHAHNNYYHLNQTYSEVRAVVKEIFGSLDDYKITKKW